MTAHWQPYRESLAATLARTGTLAAVAGLVIAVASPVGLARWPLAALLALWPALGGHFVELWFVNWLRPRLPDGPAVQAAARLGTWFAGGCLLAAGMALTVMALGPQHARWPRDWHAWWQTCCLGGLGFVAIELAVHLVLHLRGLPSFYNRRDYRMAER